MLASELIRQLDVLQLNLTSMDVPIKLDGREVDIELELKIDGEEVYFDLQFEKL